MYISLKNLGLLVLLLLCLAGIALSIWWLVGDGGREPVVALVGAVVSAGFSAYGIDWNNLIIGNSEHDANIFGGSLAWMGKS